MSNPKNFVASNYKLNISFYSVSIKDPDFKMIGSMKFLSSTYINRNYNLSKDKNIWHLKTKTKHKGIYAISQNKDVKCFLRMRYSNVLYNMLGIFPLSKVLKKEEYNLLNELNPNSIYTETDYEPLILDLELKISPYKNNVNYPVDSLRDFKSNFYIADEILKF